jgi:hypothetical protein
MKAEIFPSFRFNSMQKIWDDIPNIFRFIDTFDKGKDFLGLLSLKACLCEFEAIPKMFLMLLLFQRIPRESGSSFNLF